MVEHVVESASGYGRNASSVDAALASSGAAWRTAVPCALNSQSGWPKQDGLDALSLDVAMSVMSFRSNRRPQDFVFSFVTLRDPLWFGPAHPREHGDSAAPKSLDPKQ